MIGQTNLIARLKSYTIATLPHSIILCGDSGCGKHTLVSELSKYFNLDVNYITDNISLESIEDISENKTPAFYVIEANNITEKQQNVILKFLEEPSALVYIIILCESNSQLLETVLNRCVIFEFESYTYQELLQFITDDDVDKNLILTLCNTPGRIKQVNSKTLQSMNDLCLKIIDKIASANYSNTLSISNKINYDKNFDKFDVKVFMNCLLHNILNKYIETPNSLLYKYYNIVNKYSNRLNDSRLNKEMIIEQTLSDLWLESRD